MILDVNVTFNLQFWNTSYIGGHKGTADYEIHQYE